LANWRTRAKYYGGESKRAEEEELRKQQVHEMMYQTPTRMTPEQTKALQMGPTIQEFERRTAPEYTGGAVHRPGFTDPRNVSLAELAQRMNLQQGAYDVGQVGATTQRIEAGTKFMEGPQTQLEQERKKLVGEQVGAMRRTTENLGAIEKFFDEQYGAGKGKVLRGIIEAAGPVGVRQLSGFMGGDVTLSDDGRNISFTGIPDLDKANFLVDLFRSTQASLGGGRDRWTMVKAALKDLNMPVNETNIDKVMDMLYSRPNPDMDLLKAAMTQASKDIAEFGAFELRMGKEEGPEDFRTRQQKAYWDRVDELYKGGKSRLGTEVGDEDLLAPTVKMGKDGRVAVWKQGWPDWKIMSQDEARKQGYIK